jgi:dolichyl-phosphate-mannose--protein O-mannosyl transferase
MEKRSSMNETPSIDSTFRYSWKIALVIMILAAFFRLWGTFDLNEHIEDEKLHVSYAKSLYAYGTTTDWGWHHPQLSGLIMYGTLRMFGDNPVGWRSSNVLFGTASVALIFMIGRLLYPGTAAPLLAASLLAFDPHHIYLSRTTFVEIMVTFFFLLYLYLLLQYSENKRATLPFAGLAMGLTIGTKAYFVFAIPLSVLYALYKIRQRGELTRSVIVDFVVALLLLPFAVYFLSYIQWFSRGYTLYEFIQMKMDAVWALKELSMDNFAHHQDFLGAGGKPWEWFIKPMFWGYQRLLNSEEGRFLLQCNNPPFRLLVLPSVLAASVYAWKQRSVREVLAPLLFVGSYLLTLLVTRPIFSYSSAAVLPFAYLALARTVTIVAVKINKEKVVYGYFLFSIIIWGAYMFPIVSARLVPLAPFRPILSVLRFLGDF